jgi:carbon monoxide dehydrogenase subunit G
MIRVTVTIGAPREVVWAFIRDIATHTSWMVDAVAIRFTSTTHEGAGTTFDCDTRVGPIRLTDKMRVTEWIEPAVMGIVHVGLVTGTGRFTLETDERNDTRFTWEEVLRFPWFMGGAIGVRLGTPVLSRIWRRNLRALKEQIESRGQVIA